MKCSLASAGLLVAPLAIACAGYPAPTERLASSYASIRAAQEVGGQSVPQAALHLRLAQEEQAKAKDLVAEDKNREADTMAMRAAADAELAMAMARESAAQQRSTAAAEKVSAASRESRSLPPSAGSVSATTTTTSTTVPAAPSK